MNLLIAHSEDLSARHLAMVSSRRSEKESITKNLPLLVKRRAKQLVKESINKKLQVMNCTNLCRQHKKDYLM